MNIPETVDIDGIVWKVIMDETIDNNGETNANQLTIKIDPSINRHRQEITLMHELLHAILDMAGSQEDEKFDEEQIAHRLSRPILYLFEKNNLV